VPILTLGGHVTTTLLQIYCWILFCII